VQFRYSGSSASMICTGSCSKMRPASKSDMSVVTCARAAPALSASAAPLPWGAPRQDRSGQLARPALPVRARDHDALLMRCSCQANAHDCGTAPRPTSAQVLVLAWPLARAAALLNADTGDRARLYSRLAFFHNLVIERWTWPGNVGGRTRARAPSPPPRPPCLPS